MTDEHSPWSRPETETVVAGGTSVQPQQPARPDLPTGGAPSPAGSGPVTDKSGYRPGAVTRLGSLKAPTSEPFGSPVATGLAGAAGKAGARERAMMRWFVGVAAAIVAVGLVVVLTLVMTGRTGDDGPLSTPLAGPADTRPDLAKRCPPPSDAPERGQRTVLPTPPGPRTVDSDAGISYAAYGDPWQPWDQVWRGGELKVTYRVGQHFITEPGPYGRGYHASILSGSVPATVNDAMVLDLECTGRQVAADARSEYYLEPNTMETIRDERATVGGMPAWVTKFRVGFNHRGLKAKDELVAIVLLDVGRPEAAILYVSIPGTHHEWDHIVDEVIDSVRPT